MSATKRYKVFMDLKSLLSADSTAKPVKEAGVFFFMDVKHDAAGKPIAGEVHAFDNSAHSKFNSAGLEAEYKSFDGQNVCTTLM